MVGEEPCKVAHEVLNEFNAALFSGNAKRLLACFFATQVFWRDQLALTCHLRTFSTPNVVATSLLQTSKLRGLKEDIKLEGAAQFVPATPTLVSRHILNHSLLA